jgi:3-oxoacyl-[acyl-carrier protein] reductase
MTARTNATPRVALITGGTSGIGRETALRLARDSFAVVVNFARNKLAGDETVAELEAAGAQALAIQADVADEHAVASMFDQVEERFGGIDVLVNAAGIMPIVPLADLDLAVLDQVLRTNVRGTFVVDQQAARRLRTGGAIINISSSIVKFSRPGYTAYGASKGAVEAITLMLARELRGRDITVNTVAPGPMATPLFFEGKSEELLERIRIEPPMERFGEPADAAEAIAFLAGPGRWVNGQILYVNGGAI